MLDSEAQVISRLPPPPESGYETCQVVSVGGTVGNDGGQHWS